MELASRIARTVLSGSLRNRLGDRLCSPRVGRLVGRAFRERIPARGIRVDTAFDAISDRTRAQIFWGIYESAEVRFVRQHLRPDLDVVELGSSLGVVSTHIRRKLRPEARLVCVEANPRLLPIIRANLRANRAEHNVEVLHRAIDYDPDRSGGTLLLHPDTASARLSSADAGEGSAIQVPTARLGPLLEEQAIERYALVADIEGAEAGIFLEDAEALERCDQIIAELHATHHQGHAYSYLDLTGVIERRHGFRKIAEHGPVFAFAR